MNQTNLPLCHIHQLPIIQITLITSPNEDFQMFCPKCPQTQNQTLDVQTILNHLQMIQITQQPSIQNYIQFLLSRINTIQQDFLQTIQHFSKQVKDQIKFYQSQLITPETTNYFNTIEKFTIDDLKQLSSIFALNFQMDNNSQYQKTNYILKQQITILHHKIKEANQLKLQIENSFNPDYQISSQIQTDEEDHFSDIPKEYKNYIEKHKIEYSSQIKGIQFSYDNQYIFAFSHELPLTAFKVVDNKLAIYQQLEDKPNNLYKISTSKIANRIYATFGKIIQIYEENQEKHWNPTQNFDMNQNIHLIQVSVDEKIAIAQLRNITIFYPLQDNKESKQISLPQKYKKIFRDLSFNQKGQLLVTTNEEVLIIWKICNQNQIEMYQCFENQWSIYAQFNDSSNDIICSISSGGNRHFWIPDSKGNFYESQSIYTSQCTFGCTIKFRLNSKLVILGNHSIEILEQDQQNNDEWIVQQKFKINCWNLDVSKDAKYIVADDFSKLCLFVREE
ncbi:unnamed protein product [Paramecium sonneborni]|uniref:WD40-repeat-containing domain n=1 Tax=Paramecium sonneborni TaxID=65129 RepID=A0A8S1QUV0_9CILI|nr:unnamed protein product [Paramecium sonneborni]